MRCNSAEREFVLVGAYAACEHGAALKSRIAICKHDIYVVFEFIHVDTINQLGYAMMLEL